MLEKYFKLKVIDEILYYLDLFFFTWQGMPTHSESEGQ